MTVGTVSPCSAPGLIGDFYTMTLHGRRSRDRVAVVYSRSVERGEAFRTRWDIPTATTSIEEAVNHADVDVVVDRSAEPSARGGDRHRRLRRQARAVHEAARPLGRGGQADPRHRRVGRAVRRVPRGPRLHAEDDQVAGRRRRRCDRRRDVGAGAGRPTLVRTARGSGTPSWPAAGASSTSAATASRSSATTSARRTGRSR